MEPQKKKKPPACDRCKAKRVLCHPNPAGCPRCHEKGVECTTTPVVRRKPQKKNGPAGAASSSLTASTSLSGTKPIPPEFAVEDAHAQPALQVDAPPSAAPPLASTSQVPYSAPALALPIATDPLSALSLVPTHLPVQGVPAPEVITPELAQHLFHCFEQTSYFDHTLFRTFPLRPIFESTSFDLSLLPSSRRVLAHAVLALGALFSFSPLIVGSAPLADGRLLPTSFADLDGAGVQGRDLREFGRRRYAACAELAERAERMAKEEDVAFVCSMENAATALLLDGLATAKAEEVRSRPWLAVYMRYLRELADEDQLGLEKDHSTTMWAIHLSADIVSEIDAGRLTSTYADHLALVGSESPDIAQLDKSLKETLKSPIDKGLWPDIRPIPLIYLAAARDVTDKLLGTHARNNPLDHAHLSSFLSTLSRLQSISTSFCLIVDQLLSSPIDSSIFPHAHSRRVRWTKQLALQGTRNFAVYIWTSLILPLYRELQRRDALLRAEERAASARGEERDFEAKQEGDKLRLALQHVREFVRVALVAKVDGMDHVSNLATFATLRKAQLVDWAAAMVEEIEAGAMAMDEKLAYVAQRLSAILKLGGYAYSSPAIDGLILRLDTHLLAFRLATSPTSAASSSLLNSVTATPFALPAAPSSEALFPFSSASAGDLSLSLFSASPSAASTSAAASFAPLPTTSTHQQQHHLPLPLPFATLSTIPTPSPQHSSPSDTASPASAIAAAAAAAAVGLSGVGDQQQQQQQQQLYTAPDVGPGWSQAQFAAGIPTAAVVEGGAGAATGAAAAAAGTGNGAGAGLDAPAPSFAVLDEQTLAGLTAPFAGGGGGPTDAEMQDVAASLGISDWGLW